MKMVNLKKNNNNYLSENKFKKNFSYNGGCPKTADVFNNLLSIPDVPRCCKLLCVVKLFFVLYLL